MAKKKRTKSTESANVSDLQEPNSYTNIQENARITTMAMPFHLTHSPLTVLFFHQPPVPLLQLSPSSQELILKTYLVALISDMLLIIDHLILCIITTPIY